MLSGFSLRLFHINQSAVGWSSGQWFDYIPFSKVPRVFSVGSTLAALYEPVR
jgi:hypothetical protein